MSGKTVSRSFGCAPTARAGDRSPDRQGLQARRGQARRRCRADGAARPNESRGRNAGETREAGAAGTAREARAARQGPLTRAQYNRTACAGTLARPERAGAGRPAHARRRTALQLGRLRYLDTTASRRSPRRRAMTPGRGLPCDRPLLQGEAATRSHSRRGTRAAARHPDTASGLGDIVLWRHLCGLQQATTLGVDLTGK